MLISAMLLLLGAILLVSCGGVAGHPPGRIAKKSFDSIGCLGNYDRAKFARLNRICDECYSIYRESEIHTSCRELCFKNDVFPACVDALLLKHEEKELNEIVDELLGK